MDIILKIIVVLLALRGLVSIVDFILDRRSK